MAVSDVYIYDEINTGLNPLDVPIVVSSRISGFDEINTGVNPNDTTILSTGSLSAQDETNTGIDMATVDENGKLSAYDEENVINSGTGAAILPIAN